MCAYQITTGNKNTPPKKSVKKMKKWAKIVLMIALTFCSVQVLISSSYLTSAVPAQSVWAVYARDSQRTGRSPYSGPGSPTLEWELDILLNVNEQYCAALAVGSDDTVYVGSSDEVLVIKDAREDTLASRGLCGLFCCGRVRWDYLCGCKL